MSRKEIALEAVSGLSDECTFEEIIERLQFVAGIQLGVDELNRGDGIPHEQVMREISSWLSEYLVPASSPRSETNRGQDSKR